MQQPRRPAARGPTRGARAPPSGSPSAGAAAARPRPRVAVPQPKRQRASQQPKLTDLLLSASKEQLVSLVRELDDESGGSLAERVAALLPPDLRGIKDEVEELRRKVDKAFPNGAAWAGGGHGAVVRARWPLECVPDGRLEFSTLACLSMPRAAARWGSNRDAYAYCRVGPALRVRFASDGKRGGADSVLAA